MKVVVLLSKGEVHFVVVWLLVDEVHDGLLCVAVLEHRLLEAGETCGKLRMALGHETAADILQELVAADTRRLGCHGRNWVLWLGVVLCSPMLLHARLQVALGLAVKTLELFLVEVVKKRAGK